METEIQKTVVRKGQSKKRVLLVIFGLLLTLGVTGFLGFYFCRVTRFEIEGNEGIEAKEIIEKSGVPVGRHALQLDYDAIRAGLEADPHILVESVRYVFPETLKITVRVRQEDAVIQYLDENVFIDEEGVVLRLGKGKEVGSSLLVRGLAVTGYALNEKLGVLDEYQLRVLCDVIKTLKSTNQRNWYVLADVSNSVNVKLLTYDYITVEMGQASGLEQRLQSVSAVLSELKEDGAQYGVVNAHNERAISYAPPVNDQSDGSETGRDAEISTEGQDNAAYEIPEEAGDEMDESDDPIEESVG